MTIACILRAARPGGKIVFDSARPRGEDLRSMSTAEAPRPLFAFHPEELAALCVELGGKAFHAKVLRAEVLERGVLDYAAMTGLSKTLRSALAERAPILVGSEVARSTSGDRTTKLLIDFGAVEGRSGAVETVHIPSLELAAGKGATLCVSTQVGCPVQCPFCASGKLGLARNLEAHEIVEQYLRGRALGPVSRSVVMGIGEPLLNYANVSAALDVVHDDLGLGARKVTVSTVGFPDRLRKIAPEKPRFQLAISLHTPFDEQRDELVPAMKGVPIEEVLAAADFWFECTGREVTYEYVLLAGVTDTEEHARHLAERLRRRRCTVNLIPFNPVSDSEYARPSSQAVERMQLALAERGVVATVRWSRGVADDAACGQLRVRAATARS
ncbi:MAG: 23S rRNA (adenine(2503)-C(2))-methyltransferase RlmN [Planctomycetes bacterium]|nr:23S rRNA (adenine(2503)-C(2))-methyltransferase RlmN [Planctomycetota bacterium]